MPEQRPTIGRIVTYRSRVGVDFPAIITAVPGVPNHPYPPAEGHVHLRVFYPGGLSEDYLVPEGVPGPSDENGAWRWPERT
jgi:hypothetical protein